MTKKTENLLRQNLNSSKRIAEKALILAKKNKDNAKIRHHALNIYFRNQESIRYYQNLLK